MILIKYGIKDSGPGLMIYIWKFVFRIHRISNYILSNFIKSLFNEVITPKLENKQLIGYNFIKLELSGNSTQFLIQLTIFNINLAFGLAKYPYEKLFSIIKEVKSEPNI